MIRLTRETKIQLALKPVDFRRQIDGLVALCENQLKQDPHGGILFVFINRIHTMIRLLMYDRNGYWLATKRLSRGRFQGWPTSGSSLCEVEAARLAHLLKNELDD